MLANISAVERAFQLAGSGAFNHVSELRRHLKAEGYSEQQVVGPIIVAQLRELIAEASLLR